MITTTNINDNDINYYVNDNNINDDINNNILVSLEALTNVSLFVLQTIVCSTAHFNQYYRFSFFILRKRIWEFFFNEKNRMN